MQLASASACPPNSIPGRHGIAACCPAACGECGGKGCELRPGGRSHCCAGAVHADGNICGENGRGPPCVADSDGIFRSRCRAFRKEQCRNVSTPPFQVCEPGTLPDAALLDRHGLRCWSLGQACVETTPKLRLHLGDRARASRALCAAVHEIHRGDHFTSMRHLERDSVLLPNAKSLPRYRDGGEALTLLWTPWEQGYGDPLIRFIAPLAEQRLEGREAPSILAISGLRKPNLIERLRAVVPHSTLCASERPSPPHLERCPSACYRDVRVCDMNRMREPSHPLRAMAAIDRWWLNVSVAEQAPAPLGANEPVRV